MCRVCKYMKREICYTLHATWLRATHPGVKLLNLNAITTNAHSRTQTRIRTNAHSERIAAARSGRKEKQEQNGEKNEVKFTLTYFCA